MTKTILGVPYYNYSVIIKAPSFRVWGLGLGGSGPSSASWPGLWQGIRGIQGMFRRSSWISGELDFCYGLWSFFLP